MYGPSFPQRITVNAEKDSNTWIVWTYIEASFTQHGELPGGGDA